MEPDRREGPVAIITGGTRGIGRGILRRFHEAGYRCVVCARNAPDAALRDGDREAHFVTADVRDPADAEAVIREAQQRYGRLDVLVNNAGGTPAVDLASASPRFHASIIDLNLTAPLNFSLAAWRAMSAQERDSPGAIVFISSVAASYPGANAPAYCAAKAGIDALTVSLARSFAPAVRVNCVTVGLVDTPDSGDFYGGGGKQAIVDGIPMGRFGRGEDVGDACVMLCDPQKSGWITGANLECHGGRPDPWE